QTLKHVPEARHSCTGNIHNSTSSSIKSSCGRLPRRRFWKNRTLGPSAKLQRRAGAHFEHRALVGRPRVDRESNVHRQRPEWRFPAHAESKRRLQLIDVQRILEQERLTRVAEYHPADSQSRQDRERDLVAQQQFLAAAVTLHALR